MMLFKRKKTRSSIVHSPVGFTWMSGLMILLVFDTSDRGADYDAYYIGF
jgi:hypothetical protein